AVAEAARNIVCTGAKPLGVTNCLNFGNPYDPEVYYQFVHAIRGMGDACRAFDTPVTGGNVSFYNQHPDGAVYPTPTIGMVGILENARNKMTTPFKQEGDVILLIGKSRNDINSSEYLHKIHEVEFSPAPEFNLDEELALQSKIAELIEKRCIASAHDVSEGGLLITLLESAFTNSFGFSVHTRAREIRKDAYWFGESQSRVVVSVHPAQLAACKKLLSDHPYEELGIVTDGSIEVDGKNWGHIDKWKSKYDSAIEQLLAGTETESALSTL
ncbi:MAG TPA: AIR synthase related protein, partial [Puia sp.]|nr:AIR synthase related protein [Puia sp.]